MNNFKYPIRINPKFTDFTKSVLFWILVIHFAPLIALIEGWTFPVVADATPFEYFLCGYVVSAFILVAYIIGKALEGNSLPLEGTVQGNVLPEHIIPHSKGMIFETYVYKEKFRFTLMAKNSTWYVTYDNCIITHGQYRHDLEEWIDTTYKI